MTKEELIKVIHDEVEKNGDVQFAVDVWNGDVFEIQNGSFTDEYVIRYINGVELKETYDEIDEDVLENCWECRVTYETLFANTHINIRANMFTIVSIINDVLKSKVGEDSIDISISEYGNHYDCVYWQDYQYCVSVRYYGEDGTEYTTSEPIANLSIDMLSAIFHELNK